jgi:hypothetical protein
MKQATSVPGYRCDDDTSRAKDVRRRAAKRDSRLRTAGPTCRASGRHAAAPHTARRSSGALRLPAGRSVVDTSPSLSALGACKQRENFEQRATADPLAECFLPGVPRIMYMDYPFQIFQMRGRASR